MSRVQSTETYYVCVCVCVYSDAHPSEHRGRPRPENPENVENDLVKISEIACFINFLFVWVNIVSV